MGFLPTNLRIGFRDTCLNGAMQSRETPPADRGQLSHLVMITNICCIYDGPVRAGQANQAYLLHARCWPGPRRYRNRKSVKTYPAVSARLSVVSPGLAHWGVLGGHFKVCRG